MAGLVPGILILIFNFDTQTQPSLTAASLAETSPLRIS